MYRAYRTSTFTAATRVGYRAGQAARPPPANLAGPRGLRRIRSAAARLEPGTHRTWGEPPQLPLGQARRAPLPHPPPEPDSYLGRRNGEGVPSLGGPPQVASRRYARSRHTDP